MKNLKTLMLGIVIMLALSACGGSESSPPPTDVTITDPISTAAPTKPPEPTPIVHTMFPGEPVLLLSQLISDCTIGNGVTVGDEVVLSHGCDRWDFNKIERPFEDTMADYYPQSDISKAQMGYDDAWFYAQLVTYFGEIVDPQPMNGTYGVELDLTLDGRGDVLILASQPGEDWDVAGVRVWQDIDTTVGAFTPVIADEDNPDGGYDEVIFDAGVGDDPDLAWARISPDDPNIVQFAFKRSLGGEFGKEQFSWVMWAGLLDFVPPDFDIVDTYAETEVYEIDNTCSWTFGVPLQELPNQCGIKVEEKIDVDDEEACIQPPFPGATVCWQWNPDACRWEICN